MPLGQDVLNRLHGDMWPPRWHRRPTKTLFHYTNARGLDGILASKAIWATDYRFLNDEEEVSYGEQLVLDVIKQLVETPKLRARKGFVPADSVLFNEMITMYDSNRVSKRTGIYVASFSEEPDLLSQWRAYAAFGDGYSIGFDLSAAKAPRDDADRLGGGLLRCEYNREDTRALVREKMEAVARSFQASSSTLAKDNESGQQLLRLYLQIALEYAAYITLFCKNAAFADEKEWRMVVLTQVEDRAAKVEFRPSAHGLIPYIVLPLGLGDRLPLSELYVGPTYDQGRSRDVARLRLLRDGYDPEIVRTTRVPFRPVR